MRNPRLTAAPILPGIVIFLGLLLSAPAAWAATPPYQIDWLQQFGTSDWDQAFGISAQGGSVYVTGETAGSLGGPNAGLYDGFDAKFNLEGVVQGMPQQFVQYGTAGTDVGTGISTDHLGNVFISGYSNGPSNSGFQAQLSNYNAAGVLQWTQYIGPVQTYAYGVSADGQGNAYLAGYTTGSLNEANAGGYDAYVAKYDSAGNALWTHQFGTPGQDQAFGVAADGVNGVYVAGSTTGSLGATNAGGRDAFLTKYDAAGNLQWTQQLGSAGDDLAQAVAANSGNVYVVGSTSGSLGGTNAGLNDAFVSKFNSAGALQWTKQFGTTANDFADGVAADARGNVFVVGYTQGSLGGINAGDYDAFLSEFDSTGALLWTQQFGSDGTDFASSVSLDGMGHVFVAGSTTGSLNRPNAGSFDNWVARFSIPDIQGDFNRDGVVDMADVAVMLKALTDLPAYMAMYDLSASDLQTIGDFDGDDAITNADLQDLLNTLNGIPIMQPVPEPMSFVLLAVGVLLAGWAQGWQRGIVWRGGHHHC